MEKLTLIISMSPTVEANEDTIISGIITGCLDAGVRVKNFKLTVDTLTYGAAHFEHQGDKSFVQVDSRKKIAASIESDQPKMWLAFRNAVYQVAEYYSQRCFCPMPFRVYSMERAAEVEARPEQTLFEVTEFFLGKRPDDDTEEVPDEDLPFDLDDDDDPDREERERRELEESRRERREDIRAYYHNRL